ncbi:hypothetical protein [Xinfangfangia pollutisoli]|uniref:hypothetical protein n=1 Tax=Xinfangfangia pollutisoli TaxID=2865960 RepID=UPI001CD50DA0|nr:hypothetical protein [Xinfangfangia pollutisoli]
MKRTALFALALSALAPAAFAYSPTALTDAQVFDVKRYVPNADLSNLTAAQVQAIGNVLNSGDSGIGHSIYSILND